MRGSSEEAIMVNAENGHFVWWENLTKDVKGAIAFYGEAVGLKTQAFTEGGGHYTMWVGPEGPIGGVMELPAEAAKMGAPPHWMGSVKVANVDETVALATKLGGKVYKPAFDIPTIGRVGVLGDPQGGGFVAFQPSRDMRAPDPQREGNPCWNELVTTDDKAAWSFYSQLFGWTSVQEMDMGPMGTYRVYGKGEKQLGGIMKQPPGMNAPPLWTFYFATNDLDGAIERSKRLGAKVLHGPADVPGGGRIVNLMDSQGAAFAFFQQPKKN